MVYLKNYIFSHFYSQYSALWTMVPRNKIFYLSPYGMICQRSVVAIWAHEPRNNTPSDASMQPARRKLSKATMFVLCAPRCFGGNRVWNSCQGGCVILSPSVIVWYGTIAGATYIVVNNWNQLWCVNIERYTVFGSIVGFDSYYISPPPVMDVAQYVSY